ncbi:DUF4097 family beta strand repeat-containing protein [Kineococcus sp. SYSU DK002]|uniref:hypothetical protein n=1 Tax=Kineococcus sp. SYSU DK002 TaxID=3383123 RepID=UPI003D7D3ABF
MSAAKAAVGALTALLLAGGTVSTLGQLTSEEVREQVRADLPAQDVLVVETATGDLTVRTSADVVGAEAVGTVVRGWQRPAWGFEREDGRLVFASSCGGVGWPSPCHGDWTITVPTGTRVEVRSEAGDLTFEGRFAAVTASTTAGDVEVTVPDDGTAYRVTGRSLLGDRVVGVPTGDAAADPRLDLSTTGGDVTVATS